jgi:hypothetical protein
MTPGRRTASYQKDENGWRVFIPIGSWERDANEYFVVQYEDTAKGIVDRHNSNDKTDSLDMVTIVTDLQYLLTNVWAIDWPRFREDFKERCDKALGKAST